ncbi:MAG TPA: efflux RND transporter periplasmic adaptor subunit [Methylophilus sp.]|nr:efflux RND transporter periplasmic adaptor subunit [Methylophilus sp.]
MENKYFKKSFIFIILLLISSVIYHVFFSGNSTKADFRYKFDHVSIGDVQQSVSANGTINPVTLVSVGTQVSGLVKKIYVDFNDKVKAGQVLMELDDSLFIAQIEQTKGQLRNIEASVELAKANQARMQTLYAQEYVSKQELDQSVQALKSSLAQLHSIKGQLRRDQTNLGFTIIRSPVSGVVVDRQVDVGQTVASSFQTPTLIKIAQDLSKMQINTNFTEADIGSLKEGQVASFNVDAYPNRSFEGVVKQIRLNPTTNANVVTYNVVVLVDNDDQNLLPGMTAYVSIVIASKKEAKLVPNSALRFKPKSDEHINLPASKRKANENQVQDGYGTGKVYVLQNNHPELIRVKTGITDGKFTEIISDELKEGDQVIIGQKDQESNVSGDFRMRRVF